MAEVKKNVLTYEGLKKYEEELTDLKVNKRKEIADKIKTCPRMRNTTQRRTSSATSRQGSRSLRIF